MADKSHKVVVCNYCVSVKLVEATNEAAKHLERGLIEVMPTRQELLATGVLLNFIHSRLLTPRKLEPWRQG
jgi:hypothetical protein